MLTDAQRAALTQRLRRGREAAAGQIPRRPDGLAELPLSAGQEQLWFIDQLAPGQPTYNIPLAIALTGPLDPAALSRALDDLVARHEALRTRLVAGRDGRPGQLVDPPGQVTLHRADLSGLAPAERTGRLLTLIEAESLRPFALAAGPLLRVTLVRTVCDSTGGDEHVLVVVVHHAVFDGWSAGVLLRDLAALYERQAGGAPPPPLPDLPVQFADYALWERGRLAGHVLDDLRAYWRKELDGFCQVEFPTSRARPVLEDFAGGLVTLQTDAELPGRLRELSRTHGTTVFVTLMAALFALLHRYTGQDDLIAGTVTASRSRPELAPLIGFLVHTLPIRADLSGDPVFSDLLAQVRETTIGAYAHQDLPFSGIVDAARVERDPGRSPLFQIDLVYAERDQPAVSAAGVDFAGTDLVAGIKAAKFDLELHAEARPDGLWLECSYKTALFDEAMMRRLLGHYEVLLRGVAADPSARISALPLLTEAELHREIAEWNDTAGPYPRHCIHQGFEAQAARFGDAIAAEYSDQQVSYGELNRQANQIARRLRSAGAGPEVLVGICLPAGIRRLAAVLGILKAGGGYVPLDPALPAGRLAFMITDTAMPLIVTDEPSSASLPQTSAALLCLDAEWPAISELDDGDLTSAEVTPANVAYVIYTSGSTGLPKGVVLEHRQVVNFAHALIEQWQVGPADVILGFASLSFDVSVFDMFIPLLAGGRIVLAPTQILHSPPRLGALIRRTRVTFACITPSVLSLITNQEFPGLRIMMTAGEELPAELARTWIRPGLRMVNGYGPTETTVVCSFCELDATTPMPPPIGRPYYPNYTCYVLDKYLNPVPVGVTGELHIGGVSVARGYLNRPELTEQRFIPDPYSPEPGAPGQRLYKSGDLCRRNADGTISFVGRADFQVKIRGLRIELGEIETTLTAHPAIVQAFVTVTIDPAGDKELTAYYRTAAGAGPVAGLSGYLAGTLPAYLVPANLIEVGQFPLNNNNKIDVAALPGPRDTEPGVAAGHEPLAAGLEARVGSLFGRLLGRDVVGAADNFFHIGGNSLQVMRLIDLVHTEIGADIGAATVFLHPTPRALSAVIESDVAEAGTGGPLIPLCDGPGEAALIVIHAVGGTVFAYTDLAGRLAGTFAVRGLEAPALTEPAATPATIDALADDYTERIRAAQPSGPYRLAGWSMGGILAFEIARRLEGAGAPVEFLVLLDAPYAMPPASERTEAELAGQFVADAAGSLGWEPASLPDPASTPADAQLAWLARQTGGPADGAPGGITAQLKRRLAAFSAHHSMLASYQPAGPPVSAPALIVSADRSPNARTRQQWPRVLRGPVSVLRVDGDHYDVLRPPLVAEVAASILSWHGGTC